MYNAEGCKDRRGLIPKGEGEVKGWRNAAEKVALDANCESEKEVDWSDDGSEGVLRGRACSRW